ncbi:MAG TPA: Fe-S-containing protein, partial [Nitrospirota bacterium]
VSSYLDACASCYIHKRGYEYKGGTVICRHCGTQFPVPKLEKGLGSCYPIKIEGRMENGKYLIPAATLEAAADKF